MAGTAARVYDLKNGRFLFAQRVRVFVKRLPRRSPTTRTSNNSVRLPGSVGRTTSSEWALSPPRTESCG